VIVESPQLGIELEFPDGTSEQVIQQTFMSQMGGGMGAPGGGRFSLAGMLDQINQPAPPNVLPNMGGSDVVGLRPEDVVSLNQIHAGAQQQSFQQQMQEREQVQRELEAEKDRAQQLKLEQQRLKNQMAQAKLQAELDKQKTTHSTTEQIRGIRETGREDVFRSQANLYGAQAQGVAGREFREGDMHGLNKERAELVNRNQVLQNRLSSLNNLMAQWNFDTLPPEELQAEVNKALLELQGLDAQLKAYYAPSQYDQAWRQGQARTRQMGAQAGSAEEQFRMIQQGITTGGRAVAPTQVVNAVMQSFLDQAAPLITADLQSELQNAGFEIDDLTGGGFDPGPTHNYRRAFNDWLRNQGLTGEELRNARELGEDSIFESMLRLAARADETGADLSPADLAIYIPQHRYRSYNGTIEIRVDGLDLDVDPSTPGYPWMTLAKPEDMQGGR